MTRRIPAPVLIKEKAENPLNIVIANAFAMKKSTPKEKLAVRIATARESVHKKFFDAIGELEKFDPASLKAEIGEMLTRERREIVLKLIGFTNANYGQGLEIDRTNNRDKSSIIGRYLNEHCEAAIHEWVAAELTPLFNQAREELRLDAKTKSSIKKQFRAHLEWELSRKAEKSASEYANTLVEEFVSEVKAEFSLAKDK